MDKAIQVTAAARHEAIRKRLGNRVRLLRFQRQWTQQELAEITKLHRNYIGHIERAKVNMGLKIVYQLAESFAMTVSEFLDRV